jgi:hypothetical protein
MKFLESNINRSNLIKRFLSHPKSENDISNEHWEADFPKANEGGRGESVDDEQPKKGNDIFKGLPSHSQTKTRKFYHFHIQI